MHYDIDWTTLGEYLEKLQSMRHCTQCGRIRGRRHRAHQCAGRRYDVQPTPGAALRKCGDWFRQAMEEGRWA